MIGVIGGFGDIGSRVVRYINRYSDQDIRIGGRNEQKIPNGYSSKISFQQVDIQEEASLSKYIEGCDVVINCTGIGKERASLLQKVIVEKSVNYISLDMYDWSKCAGEFSGANAVIDCCGSIPGLAEVLMIYIALRYAFSGRINKKDMDLFGLVAHGVTMRSNYHRDDNWKSIMEEHMKIYNEDMRHVAFADIVPVREFVMSYVDNTARQGRSNFGGDKFLAQFGLTSTYFTGRYLAVMVVEEESKITLYPYCDTATYGRELIMQLKATCNHYMETIYEDAMQGEWRPLSALCLDDTFILEQPMKTVSTSNYKNALDTVYELISSNLEFEGKLNEDDNFFELGGNSYKAFCIVNNLPEKYSGKLNISDFYDCNTLGDIAEILVSNRESN